MHTSDSNRLLLELEKKRRDINRAIINPRIDELSLDDLEPILSMVANARADYLCALFALTTGDTGIPNEDQVEELRLRRQTFDELVSAVNALETVIQRGYLDVKASRG
ncbi:hypothetical protein [Aestuariirhabdus litorea]|uniref:Uncharacterized protein n=1 Tax=Aestuariirhabdus litorea TaxID=2528527 RepID=A0A3P3VPC2_9GAMM|nr:hypothetical protein [Aestuariirhabdus litorea]RRJ84264.1 hypothetical protein D0544_03920 [Aestuariirhabdus litorea]RWW97486.1 hypothetical protein DZC74_03920 [Endozoicomonadaceae bacterium GTF-13]